MEKDIKGGPDMTLDAGDERLNYVTQFVLLGLFYWERQSAMSTLRPSQQQQQALCWKNSLFLWWVFHFYCSLNGTPQVALDKT